MGLISSKNYNNSQFIKLPSNNCSNLFEDNRYNFPESKTLKLNEKISMCSDNFDITDENDEIIFKLKALSLLTKKLYSNDGELLFTMKQKFISVHRRIYLIDNNKMVRAIVRRNLMTAKAKIWILNEPFHIKKTKKRETRERKADFEIRMTWRVKKLLVRDNNSNDINNINDKENCYMKIHSTSSDLSARRIFFACDNYSVYVAPNFDSRLAVFITVAVDEIFRDGNQ